MNKVVFPGEATLTHIAHTLAPHSHRWKKHLTFHSWSILLSMEMESNSIHSKNLYYINQQGIVLTIMEG